MSDFTDEPVENWQPGPDVTPALYKKWRDPRRGVEPAENLSNPVWEWLIRTRISAYQANQHFHGPDSMTAGPAWCFARHGQSRTALPDGRRLLVAGEHEDSYDPDFFIYNDVVVWHPDDTIVVHGYPETEFPPTDFHSATLVGNRLLLIGTLGYVDARKPGHTQVLSLDTESLRIEQIETTGDIPGWIYGHQAQLQDDGIFITAGDIYHQRGISENIDDWLLDLHSFRWQRLTDRQWPRFEFVRKDGEMNHLWQMRTERDMREIQARSQGPVELQESLRRTLELLKSTGSPSSPDWELMDQLYRPAVEHEYVPRDEHNFDEHNVYRIKIGDVIARYVEDSHAIVLTVEGSLPPATLDQLATDLQGKLTRLEEAEFVFRRWEYGP